MRSRLQCALQGIMIFATPTYIGGGHLLPSYTIICQLTQKRAPNGALQSFKTIQKNLLCIEHFGRLLDGNLAVATSSTAFGGPPSPEGKALVATFY